MQVIPVASSVMSPFEEKLNGLEDLFLNYDWPELPALPPGFNASDAVSQDALDDAKSRPVGDTIHATNTRAIPLKLPTIDPENSEGSMTPQLVLKEALESFLYAFQTSNPVFLGTVQGPAHHLPGDTDAPCWLGWHNFASTPGFLLEINHTLEDDLAFFRWEQSGELRTVYAKTGWNFRLLRLTDTTKPGWFCHYSQTRQTILRINLGNVSPEFVKSFLATR